MKSEVFRFKTEASQWLKKHGKPVEVVGRKALRNFLRNRKLKCEPPLTVHLKSSPFDDPPEYHESFS